MRKIYLILVVALLSFAPANFFDSTPQTLAFSQTWSDAGLITTNDIWTGVPGIEGYLGQNITAATGVDPQTLLTVSVVGSDLDVIANQSAPNTQNSGGVGEFDGIPNPTIALQGSGTADAPYVIFYLNTTNFTNITVAYNLRDIDGAVDNAVQPVALQYRVGTTGDFTNVPAGFVADATTGPSLATLVTPVSAVLPPACDNQAQVQVRVITSNAAGNDEWVGVDDINVTGTPVGGGPSLSASPLTGFGNICTGATAGPNSFTITGTDLAAADVTVAALSGFTYSTTAGGTYTGTLNFPQGGGAFSQQVFVQFSPVAVQSYNGNIVVGGGGASNTNVAATGSGVNSTPTVTSGTATAITQTTATIPGTITANGCTAVTLYGTEYSTTNNFTPGTGTQVAGGALTGNDFTSDLTGLTAATTYYYRTYATNGGGTSYSTPQRSFTSQIPEPTNHATAFACGTTTSGTIPLTWTDAAGGTVPTGYLIKWSSVGFGSILDPADGVPEANGPGILNVVAAVQAGTATSLLPATTYFLKIFPYTNSGSIIDYKIDGTVPQTSCVTTGGPIVAWQFGTPQSAGDEVTYNATTNDANLAVSVLSRGAGINPTGLQRGFSSNNFSGATKANAITTNQYIQFIIQANAGYDVSLSSLNARLRRTSTAPNAYIWAYSLDGTNFTEIGTDISFTSTADGVDQAPIDLSGITALQNVANGTTITFRAYAWGATVTTATFAVGRYAASNTTNSLAIGGTVAVNTTPNIAVSPGSLNLGQQAVSTNSTSQSINLSGLNLTGAPGLITVTAPSTDFQVSNDNSTWLPSTTIAYATATLAATPVYVRFTPQTAGAKSGNVTFSGGGDATPPTVAVSGTGTATYYSKAAGNLTDVATWGIATDGTGTSPSDFTTGGQIFTIANRASVTLNADWTVSGTDSKVVVGDGTNANELIIPSGFALTGTVDVVNNGKLNLQNTTLPTFGTFVTGSSVSFEQSGTFVIPVGTYYNLMAMNGTKTFAAGTATINGELVVDAVTGFNGAGSPFTTINLAGNFTLQNGSAFEPSPGGDASRMTLVLTGSVIQTLSGGNFELFRLQTPLTPVNSLSIVLSGNLLLGNATSGGLNLQQSTHDLSLGSGTLTIRGGGFFSASNLGTLNSTSSSNLVIDKIAGGAPIGSVGFSGGFTLNNLTVNSAGTGNNNLTLLTNLTVNNNVTLTSGRIVIATGNQLEFGNISGTGFGASKHIVTSVNTSTGAKGSLVALSIPATTAFTFPTGDGTNYLPVTVTPSSINSFTVTAFSGITQDGEPNGTPFTAAQKDDIVDAVWQVSRFSAVGDATLTTSWPASLEGASFSALADNQIGIAHNNGAIWGTVIGTGDNTANTATRTGITTFSPFGVGQVGQILPVNFGTVKATQQSNAIKVEWTNLTELEVVNYSIERSADGRNFVSIGTVNARLNNGSKAEYSFIDVNPLAGVNYYRIRSFETSGKVKYSIIVKVDIRGGATQLVLYPNPVSDGQLSYQAVNLLKGKYTVRIVNSAGQQVYGQSLNHTGGSVTEAITLPSLRAGVYSLQLSSADNSFVKTFVVQ